MERISILKEVDKFLDEARAPLVQINDQIYAVMITRSYFPSTKSAA